MLGRALSLYQTATFGGMALGAGCGVWWRKNMARTSALAVGRRRHAVRGCDRLQTGAAGKTSDNLDLAQPLDVPNVALDLRGRSGPVAILIEYVIREQDTRAFLEAMQDRERIRRRDGARQWELLARHRKTRAMDRVLPRPDLA